MVTDNGSTGGGSVSERAAVGLRPALIALATAMALLVIAFDDGGYELPSVGEIAIVAAWLLLIGAIMALVPLVVPRGLRGIALLLLSLLLGWTLVSLVWSDAPARTVATAVHLAALLAIFGLAVLSIRKPDREAVIAGVAAAIALTAMAAVASRFHPDWFGSPTAVAGEFGSGYQARLFWPIGYWNALAFFGAMGLPLLTRFAAEAATRWGRALAAFAVPAVALCIVLTLSRGGIAIAVLALVIALVLGPLSPRLAVVHVILGLGVAVVLAYALDQPQLLDGLTATGPGVAQAGATQSVLIVVSLALAVACAFIDLLPAPLRRTGTVVRPRLRLITIGVGVVLLIVVGMAAGGGGFLSNKFDEFRSTKSWTAPGRGNSVDRLSGTSSSGRWQLWASAVDAGNTQPLHGIGAGRFQLWWTANGPIPMTVKNAHSLFLEVYAELGVIGLLMIVGFFVTLAAGCGLALRRAGPQLGLVASGAAAIVAFVLSAINDWSWQETALPVAALLIAAALLAPDPAAEQLPEPTVAWRLGVGAAAVALLALVVAPTVSSRAIESSRADALAGDFPAALRQAKAAVQWQPYSASAWRQQALVLQYGGQPTLARAAALRAVGNEPSGWQNWFVLAGIDAGTGRIREAAADFRRARDLNPNSQLFRATN